MLHSTWLVREDDRKTIHISTSTTKSISSFNTRDRLEIRPTPSPTQTLQSSLGISVGESEDRSTHISYASRILARELKIRVMGRVDFENCLCNILPRLSKSQNVTQACRIFDKVCLTNENENVDFKATLC